MLKITQLITPNLESKRVENLIALIYAFISQNQKFFNIENQTQLKSSLEKITELSTMPLFPVENIIKAVRIWVINNIFYIIIINSFFFFLIYKKIQF